MIIVVPFLKFVSEFYFSAQIFYWKSSCFWKVEELQIKSCHNFNKKEKKQVSSQVFAACSNNIRF